eukprot:s419_g6.t1
MAGSRGIAEERQNGPRTRSSSRRRKIKAELEARDRNSTEAWELQQELLVQGASSSLMEAALQLLQTEHYQAVVEERSLDGLCGYPPCTKPAQALPANQRWSVSYGSREVISAEELRKYCGPDCRRASSRFCTSLQPDPLYIRPDSAVLRAKQAIAGRQAQAEQAEAEIRAEPKETKVRGTPQEEALPKVRPRAVVRFSREKQVYTVHYHEYDGGGALPDVPPIKDEPLDAGRGRMRALVRERPMADDDVAEQEARPPEELKEPSSDPDDDTARDGSDGDDDFYDPDVKLDGKSELAWVRAWGVLSAWLSEPARALLAGRGVREPSDGRGEERRPGHKGRRDLLIELLTSRLPGELSFLAGRWYELASALSVHQTLPSVTEHRLYDLLAAILIRRLYESDAAAGTQPDSYVRKRLNHQVEEAAKAFGISEKELHVLQQLVQGER